jgi:hypothetical protein
MKYTAPTINATNSCASQFTSTTDAAKQSRAKAYNGHYVITGQKMMPSISENSHLLPGLSEYFIGRNENYSTTN